MYKRQDVNGVYDIVFVNHFTNLVVDTISEVTGRVTDKYLNGSIVFDENNGNVKYSIIKDGQRIGLTDLKEWNVISYTISEDQNLIKAYVSDASVTGSVTEISEDGYRIGDSPEIYEKAASYPNEIKLRDRGTFYLDIEDKIAAVNTRTSNESAITTNYAYLVNAGLTNDFDKTAPVSYTHLDVYKRQAFIVINEIGQNIFFFSYIITATIAYVIFSYLKSTIRTLAC